MDEKSNPVDVSENSASTSSNVAKFKCVSSTSSNAATDSVKTTKKPRAKYEEKSLAEMGYSAYDPDWKPVPSLRTSPRKLIRSLFLNTEKANVTICIGDETFKCHRLALQSYSKYFHEHENTLRVELPIEKVTPYAFKTIYAWILAKTFRLEREGIIEVYLATEFLGIEMLKQQCWKFFSHEANFIEKKAIILYYQAQLHGLHKVQEIMLPRIKKSFLVLLADPNFRKLSLPEVCQLLNLSNIGVNTEIEIFLSVVYWLNYDWEDRKKYVQQVLETVRFKLCPALFLFGLKNSADCVELKRIATHDGIDKFITDSMTYQIQKRIGKATEEPCQRMWIYDKNCSYHHRPKCVGGHHVKYIDFTNYLKHVKEMGYDYYENFEVAEEEETDNKEPCCEFYQISKPLEMDL